MIPFCSEVKKFLSSDLKTETFIFWRPSKSCHEKDKVEICRETGHALPGAKSLLKFLLQNVFRNGQEARHDCECESLKSGHAMDLPSDYASFYSSKLNPASRGHFSL